MKLQLTHDLALSLVDRLKREYAETAVSNFALDITGDQLISQIEELNARIETLTGENQALRTRIETQDTQIAELQESIAPGRKQNRQPKTTTQ